MRKVILVDAKPISYQVCFENMQTLLYIADPLCSWRYGFRDEITKLKDHFSEELGFLLIMGGLRPGGTDSLTYPLLPKDLPAAP